MLRTHSIQSDRDWAHCTSGLTKHATKLQSEGHCALATLYAQTNSLQCTAWLHFSPAWALAACSFTPMTDYYRCLRGPCPPCRQHKSTSSPFTERQTKRNLGRNSLTKRVYRRCRYAQAQDICVMRHSQTQALHLPEARAAGSDCFRRTPAK